MDPEKKHDPESLERDARKPHPTTTPAEEWGNRVDTGRQIAQGGKSTGCTPGATGDDASEPRSGKDRCDT